MIPALSALATAADLECTTTSAPHSSGRWSAGERNVLSTTTNAPQARAEATAARRSVILKSGLLGARWGVRFLQRQYEVLSELASDEESVLAAAPAMRMKVRLVVMITPFGLMLNHI